jgi:hypothetical protein
LRVSGRSRSRLAIFQCEEFPVLKHALGAEVFDAFAVGYLERYPSRSYTLFQLGANFPRFLAETRPEAGKGEGEALPVNWPDFLIDLATLELTFNEVFDGLGVEPEEKDSGKVVADNTHPGRGNADDNQVRCKLDGVDLDWII